MNILIVANGTIKNVHFYKKIIKKANVIIAADGGADNCIKLGVSPNYIIGDLDSISNKSKEKFKKLVIHDNDQNTTDMEKAISLAKKLGYKNLAIIGAIGSRMDHSLSNIITLFKTKIPSKIIDESNEVFAVEKEIEIKGKKGDIVSIIPVSRVEGLTYDGLKWNVKNKNVDAGWTGTSNIMTGVKATIKLKSGKIIVIKAKEK